VFITISVFQNFVQQLSKILDAAIAIVKSVIGKKTAGIITKAIPGESWRAIFLHK